MSDTQYFYADGHEQRGPHSADEIVAMRLPPQTLVWREGMEQWQPVASVAELRPAPVNPQPPVYNLPVEPRIPYGVPVAGYPPRDSSKKVTAGILGILLGSLGVHKFVLGYTTSGLIMLLVTVFTCGWAALIFWPIGLIEGIIYLSKSDEEFYNTYVLNKREWF